MSNGRLKFGAQEVPIINTTCWSAKSPTARYTSCNVEHDWYVWPPCVELFCMRLSLPWAGR